MPEPTESNPTPNLIIPQSADNPVLANINRATADRFFMTLDPAIVRCVNEFLTFEAGVRGRYAIEDNHAVRSTAVAEHADEILSYVRRWTPNDVGFSFPINPTTQVTVRMRGGFDTAILVVRCNPQGRITAQREGYLRQYRDILREMGMGVTIRTAETASADATPAQSGRASSNPLWCADCGKAHIKYGAEIEINALRDDTTYQTVLLRKLNGRVSFDNYRADYGIDGAGVAIELRNINAESADGLAGEMQTRLDNFFGGLSELAEKFPGVNARVTTSVCGIHVHQFHKGIPRTRLIASHSLIGLLANQFVLDCWSSRLRHGSGYGRPMTPSVSHRDITPWCGHSRHATEMRMFCVFHPSVLKTALAYQEKILEGNASVCFTDTVYSEFWQHVTRQSNMGIVNPETFTKAVKYLIDKGVTSLDNVREIHETLKDNFKDVRGARVRAEGLLDLALLGAPALVAVGAGTPEVAQEQARMERVERWRQRGRTLASNGRRVIIAPSVSPSQFSEMDSIPEGVPRTTIDEPTGARGNWCDRFNTISRALNPLLRLRAHYYRNSLRRHLQTCVSCRVLVETVAPSCGYHLVTRENPSVISFERVEVGVDDRPRQVPF